MRIRWSYDVAFQLCQSAANGPVMDWSDSDNSFNALEAGVYTGGMSEQSLRGVTSTVRVRRHRIDESRASQKLISLVGRGSTVL